MGHSSVQFHTSDLLGWPVVFPSSHWLLVLTQHSKYDWFSHYPPMAIMLLHPSAVIAHANHDITVTATDKHNKRGWSECSPFPCDQHFKAHVSNNNKTVWFKLPLLLPTPAQVVLGIIPLCVCHCSWYTPAVTMNKLSRTERKNCPVVLG